MTSMVYAIKLEADELKKLNKFKGIHILRYPEASLRYIEAAELAPQRNKAAQCFIKMENIRAYECYNKAIDVRVNKVLKQIYLGKRTKFNRGLFEKLYTKGENLRRIHNLEHTCVITEFSAREIEEKNKRVLQEVVHNAAQLRNKVIANLIKFQVTEPTQGGRRITHESICRNCVQARSDLDKYIQNATDKMRIKANKKI
ncbi:hypothetical protein RF11_14807 [Thelohanellus kitauei]|uniref:Uncharacterized protein n=1 Tax=Thelohanellus kitauei TaxID=669202 RepID=A0A0C2INF6_THEKT|nr:hypothetical protein RF11_14807 [Thelohanellus kitauei]